MIRIRSAGLVLALTTVTAACDELPPAPDSSQVARAPDAGRSHRSASPQVVEITARGHVQLELSTAEIAPGWTTFRFANESHAVHFAVLEKFPDGRGLEDYRTYIAPVFQNLMDSMNGSPLSFPESGMALPAWFGDVQFTGGPGLLTPGRSGEVTVYLKPGTYVIECYVKTEGEMFHSAMGMATELVVTGPETEAKEPKATLAVTVSATEGIIADDAVRPGMHTVAVNFADQTVHGHFLGHDVHLVRLNDDTDLSALNAWMDWTRKGGLAEPAPATFVGGIQDMPAGSTGYIRVQLEPGRYAWISEVPDPAGKDMLRTFNVPGGPNR